MSIVSPESNSLLLHPIYSTQPTLLILVFLISLFLFSNCCGSRSLQIHASLFTHGLHYSRSLLKAASKHKGFISTKKPRSRSQTWLNSPSTDCVGPKAHLDQHRRQDPHTIFQPTGANRHLSALHHGSQASPTTARPSSAQSPAASLISHPE
jgi:hypothetical protein